MPDNLITGFIDIISYFDMISFYIMRAILSSVSSS